MKSPEERRAYDREWYEKNRDKRRATMARQTERVRAVIAEAKRGGCTRCEESDPRCLDFHHCRGEKEFALSRALHRGYGVERVQREIAKCDVLCANCHRKEHN